MTTDGERVRHAADRIRRKQGVAIRDARTAAGLSGVRLARALSELGLGTSDAAVSQWENGKSTPRQVTQIGIAQVLNVSWLSLFSLEGETL